ncbi:MAG: caspase family protein [Pirellulales bacterium]
MVRQTPLVYALLVAGMVSVWMAQAASSVEAAAPTTAEIQQVIRAFLNIHPDFASDPDWLSLARLVRVEPEMAAMGEGRIRVVAKTLWKLPPDQATDAVRGLEKLLAASLTEASTANRQYHGRPVADWVQESSITTGPTVTSRRLSEVSEVEIIAAVHDYVAALDRGKAWDQRGLQQLNRDLRLTGRGLGIERVTINGDGNLLLHWKLGIRAEGFWPKPSFRVQNAANRVRDDQVIEGDFGILADFSEKVNEKIKEFVEAQEAALRRLVVQGLTEHPFAGIAAPLIESLDQATIEVSIEVQPPAELAGILEGGAPRAAAPAGGQGLFIRTATGNQAANFSLHHLEYEKLARLPNGERPELERQAAEPAMLNAPVRRQDFSVDQQSFQGGTLAALAFSPDGRRLAAAGDVLRIWNLETGELEHTLRAGRPTEKATGFRDIVFSPDGKQLIAAMSGTSHRLWVYETGDYSEVKFTLDGHDEEVDRLGISDDGRYLATADIKGRVFLWDWATRRKVWGYQFSNPISRLLVSDFDVLAIDKTLDFARIPVELRFGGAPGVTDPLIELMLKSSYPGDQPKVFTNSVAISNSSDVFVIGGRSDRDGETRNYNWCAAFSSTGQIGQRSAPKRASVDHKFQILACALSSDSKLCASGDVTGLIQVWDSRTGDLKRVFQSVGKGNLSVAFGDSLNIWQFGRDRYRGQQWQYNHWSPLQLQFDFERRILTSIDEREPSHETVRDGRKLSYVLTPNHRLSLLENNQSLASVDLSSKAGWQLFGYGFHPVKALDQGYGVIVCSEDGGVMCLDPKTLRPRRSFVGHKSRVWNASVSRGAMEGKRLITSGTDGIIHVWNLERFTPTYNVAALVDDDLTVTHLYPGTSTAERLAIGDRIETIDGLSPIEWLDSEKAKRTPDGPVPIVITRQGESYKVSVELSEMGDLARPLVSAVISEDGKDWVVWTASGFYDCSPQASRWVGWVESGDGDRAARFIDGGQLRELKLRPDVVNLTLTLGDDQLALRQADANRNPNAPPPPAVAAVVPLAAQSVVVPSPPKVRMLQPPEGSVTSTAEETIEVRAVVTAPAGTRPEILFRVNEAEVRSKNIMLEGAPAPTLPPPPAGFEHFQVGQTVALRVGPNVIQVIARLPNVQTAEGMSFVTVERRLPVDHEANAVAKPTLHWCSIAVNDYEGTGLQSLQHAVNDVEKVAESLAKRKQAARFPYRDVKFHRLVDKQATKQDVGDLFDALINPNSPNVAKTGDTVGIHISAHGGIVAGTDGYMLVPHGGDPKRPRATCVLWSEFVELANSLGKQNVRLLLFVDTCRAGGLGAIESGPAKILASELSGVIYSASGAKQSALEYSEWQHGAFSLALREALEGQAVASVAWPAGLKADDDQDGVLDVRELETFVYKRVRSLTMDQQVPEHARPRMGVEPSLF